MKPNKAWETEPSKEITTSFAKLETVTSKGRTNWKLVIILKFKKTMKSEECPNDSTLIDINISLDLESFYCHTSIRRFH
jgi:hypothetical protein